MSDTGKIATVQLGAEGPQVGVQGLGCMGISEFYGDTDEASARDTLEAALEVGVTLFDTADIYGSGANETFLAPFVGAHRDEITLATKFAVERKDDDPHYRGVRNDPAYIRQAVEASLRRSWAPTSSTSTTCTAATRSSRSRSRWAPWPNWCGRARSSSSG